MDSKERYKSCSKRKKKTKNKKTKTKKQETKKIK